MGRFRSISKQKNEEIRLKNRPSYYWEDILLNKIDLNKIRLKKVTFPNCAVFKLNYLTETGEKSLRIRLDNTCSEFFKHLAYETILKLGTEPLVAIFDRIKKETEKIEQSNYNLFLVFNLVKVLNKEKLLLKQLIYT